MECVTPKNRFLRLRSRSALPWNPASDRLRLPLSDRSHLFGALRSGEWASQSLSNRLTNGQQIRLCILASNKVLGAITTALNAFPLFAVMLRIKEPSRLPGEQTC